MNRTALSYVAPTDTKRLIGDTAKDRVVKSDIKARPSEVVSDVGDKLMIVVNDQVEEKKCHHEGDQLCSYHQYEG